MEAVRNTHCADCPAYYLHTSRAPEELLVIPLHFGDRVCKGGTRPRKFDKRDPKTQVPDWCPRRISPPILRIYEFRSENDRLLQLVLKSNPSERHYCLKYEAPAPMSVKEFWSQRNKSLHTELLPIFVDRDWIVEFDDGIRPICFIRKVNAYKIIHGFKPELARENKPIPESQE